MIRVEREKKGKKARVYRTATVAVAVASCRRHCRRTENSCTKVLAINLISSGHLMRDCI